MKKLEYEKPEIEVLLIDPKVDIITTSGEGNIGGDGFIPDTGNPDPDLHPGLD